MPSGQGMSAPTTPNALAFVSPPLVQEFTYQTVTAAIYHEEVPSDRGTFILWVTLGFIDTSGARRAHACAITKNGGGIFESRHWSPPGY